MFRAQITAARLVVSALVLASLTLLTPGMSGGAAGPSRPTAATGLPEPKTVPQGPWRAGVARVVVTPDEPIFLKGYGSRTRPSEGVRQDLYVKALALQDATGATSVLVTSDLHSYTRRMSDTVAEAVSRRYGVPRDRLVLNGSHTHSGPAITGEPLLRPAEDINAEQEIVIRRYTERLLGQIVEVIGQSIQRLAPAELSFAQGSVGFGVNRRRARAGMRHLPGPVDHDVPVLRVRGVDGSPMAVVFGYSCHATSAPADYQIGGDWPGYAQAALEAAHAGTTAMFVNGCGADCDPMPRSSEELPKLYGELLAFTVGRVVERQMRALNGPLTTAFEHVDIPFQTPPTRAELQQRLTTATGMRARHARQLLGILDREGKLEATYPYPVQVWQFGTGMIFIALGGEVVVDYALRFKGQYGWEDTWVAGYSNDNMGYIPSLRVLKEGGYEGGGAMVNYGRPGPLGEAVEEAIAGKVDQLVRRVGSTE